VSAPPSSPSPRRAGADLGTHRRGTAAAADEARAAGSELRELSRGLHPAGLAEYGLEPTLAALAARSALPLEIAGLPDRRLPEVIEATLYYLVSQALANAV
jgi:signal transduction histidine kinase